MKKRRILGIIIGICLLLEGCGTGNENTDISRQKSQSEDMGAESALEDGGNGKDAEQSEEENRSENEIEQTAEGTEKEEASAEEALWSVVSYTTAYRRFLEAYVEENSAHRARVMLALIDDDNVPELLLIEDNIHASGVKVYTYYQKSVIELGEFGSMGNMQYAERGGMILGTFTGMGESDASFYQVKDGEAKLVCSLISYQPPDGRPELYEIDGISVTEEVHNKKWEELYDTGKYVVIGYDDALTIGESKPEDLLAEAKDALLLRKELQQLAEMVQEQSEVLEGYGTFLADYVLQWRGVTVRRFLALH